MDTNLTAVPQQIYSPAAVSAEQFVENLQPHPEPERGRFWRRLRRIARLRRKAAA